MDSFSVGDLVVYVGQPGLEFSPHIGRTGIVLRVDKDHFGARQAFKSRPVPRGQAVYDSRRPDFLAQTKDGIRDRLLVLWNGSIGFDYIDSKEVEVASECG